MAPKHSPLLHGSAQVVREALRVAPGRPNYAAGLRAALATTLPLLLVSVIGHPGLIWTSLAGFNTVLVDKGGAYRTRAATMLSLAVSGSIAILLGTLAAPHLWAALPLVLLVVFAGGFARLFGAEATSVGVCTAVALVVALARPAASLMIALESAGFFIAGGLWAAFISLVLWPLRPYRPASMAVAGALRELASVALGFVGASVEQAAQVRRREQLARAREAFERARAAIGFSRRGRPGPSRRGEQLVALLEAADLLFAALVALEDGLALAPPDTLPALPSWIDASAKQIAAELTRVAVAVAEERAPAQRPAARPSFTQLESALEPHLQTQTEHVPRVLARAIERLDHVSELAQAIGTTGSAPGHNPASRTEPSDLSTGASKLSLMRDHLTLDSAVFRHALRMSLSTAIAVAAMHAIELERGYWATLTCLVILQPHGSATWAKAVQRVLGTILGAAVAVLVASVFHEPHVLVLFVCAFVGLGMAMLPLNYGAFAVFLTPAFVLLAESQTGDPDLAGVRVINTLVGAAIALLGSRLLFPLSERDHFRPLMVEAFRSLSLLLAVVAAPQVSPAGLCDSRRRLGLALINAEASYQRLLTESNLAPEESEAVLSLLLYAHRLASGLIALAVAEGTYAQRRLGEREGELRAELDDVQASIAGRRSPRVVEQSESHSKERGERVEVLFDQLAVLRAAATRWSAQAASRRSPTGALLRE